MTDIQILFQTYKDDVYRLALSYTKSPADAEDVCQNTFLKLMQSKVTPGKERAWLMQVAANECRNLLHSAWWRKTAPEEDLDAAQKGLFAAQTDPLAVETPDFSGVRRALLSLHPKYRVVVFLHYYEKMSTKEIAALLHISQSAVTTRLSRSREMLKNVLKEEIYG